MSRSGFLELVRNPDGNRHSLELIVQSFEDSFMYEDRMDSYLGSTEDLSQSPAPKDALWFDRSILETLIRNTRSLLEGDYCLDNLDSATALITAYYSLCQTNVSNHMEIIEFMDYRTREFRNVVRRLEIEKNELETLQEIVEKKEHINSFLKISTETHEMLIHEIEKMKRSLKAYYFVSSLSC